MAALIVGEIDLLLVSPERFENERFRDEVLGVIARTVACSSSRGRNCISDWVHDFRPDYRRVIADITHVPPTTGRGRPATDAPSRTRL